MMRKFCGTTVIKISIGKYIKRLLADDAMSAYKPQEIKTSLIVNNVFFHYDFTGAEFRCLSRKILRYNQDMIP